MASVTFQLILYRLKELNDSLRVWFEKTSAKYQNMHWDNVDALDVYVFGWIIAAFVVVLLVKVLEKATELRVIEHTCLWLSYTFHFVIHYIIEAKIFEKLSEIKNWLIKSLYKKNSGESHFNVLAWFFENANFSQNVLTQCLEAFNRESQVLLKDCQTNLDIQGLTFGSAPPRIGNCTIRINNQGVMIVHFTFEMGNISVELNVSNGDDSTEENCKLFVKDFSGEADMVLTWDQSSTRRSSMVISTLSVQHVTNLSFEHSALNIVMPHNMDEIVCKILTGAQIQLILSDLFSPLSMDAIDVHRGGDGGFREDTWVDNAGSGSPERTQITGSHSSRKLVDTSTTFESKLLARIIKIDSLMLPASTATQVHCRITMDHPAQSHCTTCVKNTSSPYFDETFLFTTGFMSKHLKLEVFCTSKGFQTLVGFSCHTLEDLRKSPYRKFLALVDPKRASLLHGDDSHVFEPATNSNTNNNNSIRNGASSFFSALASPAKKSCGTICVEFLFMENDMSKMPGNSQNDFELSSNLDLARITDDSSMIQCPQSKSSCSISLGQVQRSRIGLIYPDI